MQYTQKNSTAKFSFVEVVSGEKAGNEVKGQVRSPSEARPVGHRKARKCIGGRADPAQPREEKKIDGGTAAPTNCALRRATRGAAHRTARSDAQLRSQRARTRLNQFDQ